MAQHPDLGAHLTNVAVVFDFFSGFAPPRHLYTGSIYRAWGNLPFESDGYWAHGVLGLLYPGYEHSWVGKNTGGPLTFLFLNINLQNISIHKIELGVLWFTTQEDSSYFTSEKGFMVETPFGDATDILLSDAPGYILQRYPVVIVASRLRSTRTETASKLVAYVENGGTLVLTADASEALGRSLFGAAVPSMDPQLCKSYPANTTVTVHGLPSVWSRPEPYGWVLCPIQCHSTSSCTPVVTVGGVTAAVEVLAGKGKMVLLGSSGVASIPAVALPIRGMPGIESNLPNPYPMLAHVRALLGERLAAQTPFTVHAAAAAEPAFPGAVVGDDLSFITTRVAAGKYVIGLANNAMRPQPFKPRMVNTATDNPCIYAPEYPIIICFA